MFDDILTSRVLWAYDLSDVEDFQPFQRLSNVWKKGKVFKSAIFLTKEGKQVRGMLGELYDLMLYPITRMWSKSLRCYNVYSSTGLFNTQQAFSNEVQQALYSTGSISFNKLFKVFLHSIGFFKVF